MPRGHGGVTGAPRSRKKLVVAGSSARAEKGNTISALEALRSRRTKREAGRLLD